MKNKITHSVLVCWHLLTEVPGWPDAPTRVRVRRLLPIIVPCAAMLLLAGWNAAVRDPQIRSVRAAHQPLLALEEEITSLRMYCSEQQAKELATRFVAVNQLLLREPAELGPILLRLKKEAHDRHWEGNFQAGDTSEDTVTTDALVNFLPVRGKLTAGAGNLGSFPALIALLEQFSSTGKRIDLTRLAIRADEQGRYAVELNLRLACPHLHEKITQ